MIDLTNIFKLDSNTILKINFKFNSILQ